MSIERFLKSLHSWMGVLILPWVFVAGLSGLYMNHGDLVLGLFPRREVALSDVAAAPGAVPISAEAATTLALPFVTGLPFARQAERDGVASYRFKEGDMTVDVAQATGAVLVQSRYMRRLYAADGTRLGTEWRWGRILGSLHRRGWVGDALGTWLADIAAGALMVFALSGLWLFAAPRLRRRKNRRARMRVSG